MSIANSSEITKITAHGNAEGEENDPDMSDADRPTVVAGNQGGGGKHATFKAQNMMIKDPRHLLTMHHQRTQSGTYRYAIKFLKEDIRSSPKKYAVGTADLVVEGMFLASLAHPNIIKVRGLPEGGVKSLYKANRSHGYFLVLDRLFNTLSDQIYTEWQSKHLIVVKKKMGFLTPKSEKEERDKNLAVRLKVAFDISAAIKFLHSKSIIYRDLKPENLGFDGKWRVLLLLGGGVWKFAPVRHLLMIISSMCAVRGDIKLFDLGLVKELHPSDMDRRGNYKLSMAGTPRYMAPECGLYQPYNL